MMAASDSFRHPTTRVHELWQTDFTYFRVIGWGWYYLTSFLNAYFRYIIAWKLYTTMAATDVKDLFDIVVEKTGIHQIAV
jgi:transposase InsO family protein